MGGKSSKYMKKEDYHVHFGHVQRLLEDLQSVQVTFADNAKDKEQLIEKFVDEIKEEQRKQVSGTHIFFIDKSISLSNYFPKP